MHLQTTVVVLFIAVTSAFAVALPSKFTDGAEAGARQERGLEEDTSGLVARGLLPHCLHLPPPPPKPRHRSLGDKTELLTRSHEEERDLEEDTLELVARQSIHCLPPPSPQKRDFEKIAFSMSRGRPASSLVPRAEPTGQ